MAIEDKLIEAAAPILNELRDMETLERLHAVAPINKALLQLQSDVAAIRRLSIRDLRATGWTAKAIGDELGITWQRVIQLETG